MVSVLVALLGGALALLPVLLVSPRRRALHFLRDESALAREMPEGEAREAMLAAVTVSAKAYRHQVEKPARAAAVRANMAFPYLVWIAFMGGLTAALANGLASSLDLDADMLRVVSWTIVNAAIFVATALQMHALSLTLARWSALRAERKRAAGDLTSETDKLHVEQAKLAEERAELEALRKGNTDSDSD